MKSVVLCIFILSLISCRTRPLSYDVSLQPFTSDGCSMSPNGLNEKPNAFLECCVQHDLAYWQGGTVQQKEQADLELKACITKNSDQTIGNLYWQGVRWGGGPQFKTPFRWGYGWTHHQGYESLSPAQQKAVEAYIKLINWDEIYKSLQH